MKTGYVAFLRGINVGGHKIIPMAMLKLSFEGMKFKKVRTFIQSGNVLFEAGESDRAALVDCIVKGLKKDFGFDIPVMVRTIAELQAMARAQPFKGVTIDADTTLYVGFMSATPDNERVRQLLSLNNAVETFSVRGREVYMVRKMPKGQRMKLAMDSLEKILGVPMTVRNWTTVNKILALD